MFQGKKLLSEKFWKRQSSFIHHTQDSTKVCHAFVWNIYKNCWTKNLFHCNFLFFLLHIFIFGFFWHKISYVIVLPLLFYCAKKLLNNFKCFIVLLPEDLFQGELKSSSRANLKQLLLFCLDIRIIVWVFFFSSSSLREKHIFNRKKNLISFLMQFKNVTSSEHIFIFFFSSLFLTFEYVESCRCTKGQTQYYILVIIKR